MLHHHPLHKTPESVFHKIVNFVIAVVATASPLITLPQLFDIYTKHNASGVSSITWLAYIFTSSIWLTYGFIHKEKIIISNGILGIILGASIYFGTLLYG
ncbi:MAG: SemiSWEET family transporter [Patescibacteria group bacterium]